MKPRHLILIALAGTGLIIVAPTAERARQSDKANLLGRPAQDVKVIPANGAEIEAESSRGTIEPLSYTGDAKKLRKR